jgi:hypothetical protein
MYASETELSSERLEAENTRISSEPQSPILTQLTPPIDHQGYRQKIPETCQDGLHESADVE